MIVSILNILGGVALLYVGGEILVKSAITISTLLGISRMIIGLTVVALGTSLPELFVSVSAAANTLPEITVANIVGSNIINIALILPAMSFYSSVTVPQRLMRIDYPVMVGSFLLATVFIIDWRTISGKITLNISPLDGVCMLILLAGYIVHLVRNAHRTSSIQQANHERGREHAKLRKILVAFGMIVLGGIMLAFGSDFLIRGAEHIATILGVSNRIIALTIVAHSTNLPECFAAFAALRRKESKIIFGNLVGSNIINTLFIFGAVGILTPFEIFHAHSLVLDLSALLIIAIFIYMILLMAKLKGQLKYWHNALILTAYLIYFVWAITG